MRIAIFSLLFVASCFDFSVTPPDSDSGASSTTTTSDASTTATPVGSGCGQDPTTGAVLCLGISLCPGLTVDQDAFSQCGFRITGGNTIDMECVCSGYLCPIGVATTCTDAQTLMSNQGSVGTVCTQVSENRCTQGTPTTTPPTSTCDKTCESECGGDPTCIQSCGC